MLWRKDPARCEPGAPAEEPSYPTLPWPKDQVGWLLSGTAPSCMGWVPVTGSRADRPDAGRIVKSVPLKEVRVTHGDPSYSEHGPKISKNQGPSGLQVAGHVWQ